MPNNNFYPALSSLISFESLPSEFSFANDFFDKIFYQNLRIHKSKYGEKAAYHIEILSDDMKITLGEFDLILNPNATGETLIKLDFFYHLEIIKYINSFDLSSFSFDNKSYFDLILEFLKINGDDLLGQAIEVLTEVSGAQNKIEVFIAQYNSSPGNLLTLQTTTSLENLVNQIQTANVDIFTLVFSYFIEAADDAMENLKKLFASWLGLFSIDTIKDMIIPKFSISLASLEVGLAFPRTWLQPVDANGVVIPGDNKSMLKYTVGSLSYDSVTGFDFANEDSFSLTPSQIGNTGLIIELEGLKLDFKKDKNIPEADADGRPVDFRGVYAKYAAVTLPAKWFKNEDDPQTTLKLSGSDLLIGTGGVSGTIALTAVVPQNPITEMDFMWLKIGSSDSFKVGFNKFDITFRQNKIIASNIIGALEIKKFVYPEGSTNAAGEDISGDIVRVKVEGHLYEDGDFNLTASADPPFSIELKNVFTYKIKSLELGKEDEDYYIGTAGTLEFQGFLKDRLKLGAIDINRLRIYSDGSIEFEGGSIHLAEPQVLKLGPVEITVTAIHYGSHQKEYNGQMRKFNYFGFDGGISVDPLGVEIRGDGVKFYYCVDDIDPKPDSYLHIQTIYLDLTIPASTPVAIINGWLSIPEPGVSKEYAGGIKLQLPKVGITGKVDMKLMPKYPAFIIDAELEFPVPIPLGTFAIYGFRGLFGYRYVAEKEAVGLISGEDTWYDYYKAPPRGIHVKKFRGPGQTTRTGTPVSIGAGASLGTSFDNGTVLNIKAMVLLSIPSLFMIDGRAAIISARLGLDDTGDPPFFAFVAIGDNSLEFGFGADFKLPKSSGAILSIYADVQAGFFFKNQRPWYVNVGTDVNPITARIVTLITLQSYVMLSAKGIAAGARGEFNFDRNYGIIKVRAWAYIEVGGKISFEKPQFGSYLKAEVGADIDIKIVSLYLCVGIGFGVEAPKPFKIYGKFYFKVKIKIAWVFKFSFSGNLEVIWEFNSTVDRDAINPMITAENFAAIKDIVKGINMLSNESFPLAYLGTAEVLDVNSFDDKILNHIIPLDTYIDIKTEKGLVPGIINDQSNSVTKLIGGITNPPSRYTDLMPPDSSIKDKIFRQVKHSYSIQHIQVLSWSGSKWMDYNPYKALYPDDNTTVLNNLKIGQFQKTDNQYNTVRLLATTPFSFTEQGEPGWHIPERYGMTAASLFCEADQLTMKCANFEYKNLGQRYYCYDPNQLFYSDEVTFLLRNRHDEDFAFITNLDNPFTSQSLAFRQNNILQIIIPQPSVEINLKLSSPNHSLKIKYFSTLINDGAQEVPFGNPNPDAIAQNLPFERIVNVNELNVEIAYRHPEWRAVSKITIEAMYPEYISQQVDALNEQIAIITENNNQISLGNIGGEIVSTDELEEQLHDLECSGSTIKTIEYIIDRQDNIYAEVIDGEVQNWQTNWNHDTGSKFEDKEIGFYVYGEFFIESDYPILEVIILPNKWSTIPIDYDVTYIGNKALISINNIEDFLSSEVHHMIVTTQRGGEGCGEKDEKLCKLYEKINKILEACLENPQIIEAGAVSDTKECFDKILEDIYIFDKNNPAYGLMDALKDQMKLIKEFIGTPTLENYPITWNAVISILKYLNGIGNCVCECDDECDKDYNLCNVLEEITVIYEDCLLDDKKTLNEKALCAAQLVKILDAFDDNYQEYEFPIHFQSYYAIIKKFITQPSKDKLPVTLESIEAILNYINTLGNCSCIDGNKKSLMFHEICWMSLENYQYNQNIPSSESIQADAEATIAGITQFIQPIWRPDTSYMIRFTLKDTVDDSTTYTKQFSFNYGFTTAGPPGYFHENTSAKYGDVELYAGYKLDTSEGTIVLDSSMNGKILEDANGLIRNPDGSIYEMPNPANPAVALKINAHPDLYALTGLKQYIDYNRSYPNADGNLLNAKPLFYKDETTQIYLFFKQAYVTHFFKKWEKYNGIGPIDGRLKIVIKDPREDDTITNPPQLDYVETEFENIPQTVHDWREDENPQVPFVISQYLNMYNNNNCIITGGEIIKPASEYVVVTPKNLKAKKLYTAIVNNMYDVDHSGEIENVEAETREIHRFVFQTSQYETFRQQIQSYKLKETINGELLEKEAIYHIEYNLTQPEIQAMYNTILGLPIAGLDTVVINNLKNNFQHPYDRIIEGILGFSPINTPVSTEFNVIRNGTTGKIIAVIVKNPEPFNNPKMPLEDVADTIEVLSGITANNNFKVLFSKDYAQAIIMHSSLEIETNLKLRFRYKIWNGNNYIVPISGTEIIDSLNILNN